MKKDKFYILECEDCEQELFDGTLKEIKNRYDENYLNYDNAEEGIINYICERCARLNS